MTCNFHRQLSGVYTEETYLFIEEFPDALFIKNHPFIKIWRTNPTPPTLKALPALGA